MDFDKAVAELETLVETLERDGDERALYLLQLVDAIHRPALERMAAGDFDDPVVEAVLHMYEILEIAEGEDDAIVLAQIEKLRGPVYSDVESAADLEPGDFERVTLGGLDLLVINFEGDFYALRDGCRVDGNTLEGARLTTEGVLVCPWHNCAYDVRTGSRVDGEEGEGLPVVPVAQRNGSVQVAVNVA
jgi:nitrite reductase/ring-hydroxylating ferredoxin subunit